MESPYICGSVVESPVALVITESHCRANAMTVSFFSEVAHHPTTLWVSIAQQSYTHQLLRETGRFSLIVLHRKQKALAHLCGSVSGRDRDKCASLSLYPGREGYLFLKDAIASSACRIRREQPVGDHTLFIADIIAGDIETRNTPLPPLTLADLR